MKYTVKVELAVHEAEGELDDVFRSEIRITSASQAQATALGQKIDECVKALLFNPAKYTK